MREKRAFVLLTALPPTKGHLNLIRFAQGLAPTTVIIGMQPDEPYRTERVSSIFNAVDPSVDVRYHSEESNQDPESEGFWPYWRSVMTRYGMEPGDYLVASEHYGAKLAEVCDGIFMPYDITRSIYYSKATFARNNPRTYFDTILPEFQPSLIRTITLFGAESTGKTTLSIMLAERINAHWIFEYARPYMIETNQIVTTDCMIGIWNGQRALQEHAKSFRDKPFVIQDTDLFTTVGYWDFWDGQTPSALVRDAISLQSDLYLIASSNIPFEPDPLRFGGDKRESTDQYWIDLCERYNLNYKIIHTTKLEDRLSEAAVWSLRMFDESHDLSYERQFNDA